jgi:3-deoxy-D-manno-octulosonate 8-phosphate phosphatase (KDO 8-P phosphatase)
MMSLIDISKFRLLVFDFDGVLTDNRVLVFDGGREAVLCSRSDGLAFDIFRRLNLHTLILSTETNPVVAARAKKMNVPVLQGIEDKAKALMEYCGKAGIPVDKVSFIGNDINDEAVMRIVGLRLCPQDAHPDIKAICDYVIPVNGGCGVARYVADMITGNRIV